MKIAAIQMNSTHSVSENLDILEPLFLKASEQGVRLVLLPENFAFMGSRKQLVSDIMEDFNDGPIQSFVAEKAKEYGIWIIAGSIPIKNDDQSRSYARCMVFDSNGALISFYDKIHLFDVVVNEKIYKESSFIEPGSTPVSIQTPWFKLGLSICYDVRFPELYRSKAFDGVDLIVVPAAFTIETGAAHWKTLLTSRAIENLSYVLAAAQWGDHYGDRKTYGYSMIINPWGETVNALPSGNGVVIAEIDLELITEIRENFPALLHRKILSDS